MKFALKFVAVAAAILCVGSAFAQKGEVVKMVRIDPLTGLLGPVGVSQLKGYQFFAAGLSCGLSSFVIAEIFFFLIMIQILQLRRF